MDKVKSVFQWWSVRLWLPGILLIVLLVFFEILTLYEGLQILITYTLVLVTAEYAKSAARQTRETQESRYAASQPVIVLGRTIAYGVMKEVRQIAEQTTIADRTFLYNVGTGPALNLHFYIKEPNRHTPMGTITGKELVALSLQEGYELNLDNAFSSNRPSGNCDLIVEYEDIFGSKFRSGLELNKPQQQEEFTVMNLFFEEIK